MADRRMEDTELEALLASARQRAETLPASLEARILADAASVQTARLAETRAPAAPGPGSPFRQLLAALGGWPALGGLATACAAGLWIGLSPPDFLPDPVGMVLAQSDAEEILFGGELTGMLGEES